MEIKFEVRLLTPLRTDMRAFVFVAFGLQTDTNCLHLIAGFENNIMMIKSRRINLPYSTHGGSRNKCNILFIKPKRKI